MRTKICNNNSCVDGCFARNTTILVPNNKKKAVQDFNEGDLVMAAGLDLKFEPKEVLASRIAKELWESAPAVILKFEVDASIVVSPDHLFLVQDKQLKRAGQLTTNDFLLNKEGLPLAISEIIPISYDGGMHSIATELIEPDEDLGGNLIVANGVICGDYSLQLHYLHEGNEQVESEENIPAIDSQQYIQENI